MNYYGSTNVQNQNISEPLKVIYGLIGGIQTIIHMLSSLLDVYYFATEFKRFVIDTVVRLVKSFGKIVKYIFSLRWFWDIGKGYEWISTKMKMCVNESYKIYFKIGMILMLVFMIYLKKMKEAQLIKAKTEEKKINEDNI